MTEVLKMTISGDPDYIKIAGTAMAQAATLHGMDMEKVNDVQVAVGEACQLITCHGYEGWSSAYDLTCDVDEDEMRITIKDDLCTHELCKTEKHRCLECPGEGDIGIRMIQVIMDEVLISRTGTGCNSITLIKRFK